MALMNFQVGCKAEAVDDDGVWCRCTVILNENDEVTVSFDGWKSEWDRKICDASQIRVRTAVSGSGRKKTCGFVKRGKIELRVYFFK